MATEARQCLHCGKELTKQQVWRDCKYCSRECFVNGYWGEAVEKKGIKSRSKRIHAAYELCQSGMTQAQAAQLLGVHPQTVSDWFTKHNIVLNRRCAHCGKPVARSNRTYCSTGCAGKAGYLRAHPEMQRRRIDPELRTKALEMYWGGLEGTFIARNLDLPEGTVHSWIHDFGQLRKRVHNPDFIKLLPANLQIEGARCVKDWQNALRGNAPDGDSAPVFLVCGTINGRASVNTLASFIFDRLKRDPRVGELYAFCSGMSGQISILWRDAGGFRVTKIPKLSGGYIWPKASVGIYITVRKNEFDYLLTLSKKRGAKPYFT